MPPIAFKVDGRDSTEISTAVAVAGIGIRFGDFHSKGLAETVGASANSGVLRLSMVHYNAIEKVDRLIAPARSGALIHSPPQRRLC
ncbi:MAG: aminotransferase class V-fold PLP-dependent enzyme [Ancalomicrobiaceae bacterium]|nr:aminotransferase class V-fold PLP-dependent enzyme [Ancalomicrobiaceae bacterium]